jgi:hypothetical protein
LSSFIKGLFKEWQKEWEEGKRSYKYEKDHD